MGVERAVEVDHADPGDGRGDGLGRDAAGDGRGAHNSIPCSWHHRMLRIIPSVTETAGW